MKPIKLSSRKRFFLRSLTMATAMWLGLTLGDTPVSAPEPAAAEERQHKRTAAYVFDRAGLILRDDDAANIDQLNFSFALIRNGAVNGDHWLSIATFRSYIEKHPHILPVLSVGGWGADGFSQAAATEAGRARFVESALALMEEHGFLGLDIDWEYPGSSAAGIATNPNDREHYTLLLKALRQGLNALTAQDGKPRLLAIALGADPSLISNIDCSAVGSIVDQINLMTYDLHSRKTASHHTPLYSASESYPLSADRAVQAFAAAGIPKSKIMLGAAFYARIYTLASATDTPVFATASDNGSKSVQYRALVTDDSWRHYFDEQAKAAYSVSGKRFATYDNPLSISYKGAYAIENSLMGLMCWEYGGDHDGELLSAMRESLQN
ncbi:MAG: glycosyl hydrolase family 18 protein [Eubacteriales bacterium]|nr:glycosyl hydrolase family 18 protein [Eubacteriales bacterium]